MELMPVFCSGSLLSVLIYLFYLVITVSQDPEASSLKSFLRFFTTLVLFLLCLLFNVYWLVLGEGAIANVFNSTCALPVETPIDTNE